MHLSDFDYHLPRELIAQYPRPQRGQSRLLVLHRDTARIEHVKFADLSDQLQPGDCLVLNETKVFPARLMGIKEGTGGKVELLLVKDLGGGRWHFMVRPSRGARKGVRFLFGEGRLRCELEERIGPGRWLGRFNSEEDLTEVLARLGQVPLPPYIRRDPEPGDRERYQTVYARYPGAVAAPTAGLHFTGEFLDKLIQKGVQVVSILLHVGPGTFRPVRETDIRRHKVEEEYFQISPRAAQAVNRVKKQGGRIVAVGTTTVRALETMISAEEGKDEARLQSGQGWTSLFIYPPFHFRAVDILITNFHLPRSTLLMLVSAFAGREKILRAYREAIDRKYLFYSYGDAMLIL